MPDPLRKTFHKRFVLRILLPVLCAVLAVVLAAAGASGYLMGRRDAVALERQEREARAAVTRNILKLSTEQETIAIWDDPIQKVEQSPPDLTWLHENIGGWLFTMFGQDRVFILDGQDRAIYAMENGARSAPVRYVGMKAGLQPFVDAVRGRTKRPDNPFERLPDRPVPAGSQVLTGSKAIHATDLALLGGRPAIVSVMRMMPFSARMKHLPHTRPLLISVRYLDGEWLHELERQNLIDGARFSPSPKLAPDETALPLESGRGRIGYLIWRPERPGTMLRQDLAWVGAGLTIALLLVLSVLVRALYRSAMRVFQSELDLRKTVLELRASEAQAQHLAFHDVLTGLPNRALFRDRFEQALGAATPENGVALLLLDIDRFKLVNDTLGHQAGDALINEFGARVNERLPRGSTLARLGGDEFAILIADVRSVETVETLCEAILAAIRRPFEILGTHAYVGTSIGVAFAPDCGLDRTELMRKADIALYAAKAAGRDRFRLFAAEMDETIKTRSVVEADLRAALETGGELQLFYQPQVTSPGGPVIGLEALVRWQHPVRGLISPEAFIPVAEESGLIVPLGEWILREACRASRRWPELFVAVNLSPVQFRTAGFAARVIEIVAEEGADPRSLELEITESVLMQNDEQVVGALAAFRAAGFRIALDDFGTGYSSLSYLSRFDVDKIKIDRSFVQNLGTVDAAAIITAVVTLGHAMGLQVTAEGVETAEQSAFLSAAGCNVLQGYFFSRAVPEPELLALIEPPVPAVAA